MLDCEVMALAGLLRSRGVTGKRGDRRDGDPCVRKAEKVLGLILYHLQDNVVARAVAFPHGVSWASYLLGLTLSKCCGT